jgi:RNase P/RNase MRP subunit POP5
MEKKLIPSHRENKRYVLFEGKKENVEETILKFIGVLGYAKAGISFIDNNILAVNREEVDKVRAALLLGKIKVLRVSGTIKGLGK